MYTCAHFLFTYAHYYNYTDNAILYMHYSIYIAKSPDFTIYAPIFACLLFVKCHAWKIAATCAHGWSLSFWQMFYTQENYRFLRMALMIYDAHVIYFHMDAARSVALDQSYFNHPDYSLVCCWISANLFDTTIIMPVGAPNVLRYVWVVIVLTWQP